MHYTPYSLYTILTIHHTHYTPYSLYTILTHCTQNARFRQPIHYTHTLYSLYTTQNVRFRQPHPKQKVNCRETRVYWSEIEVGPGYEGCALLYSSDELRYDHNRYC
jgi:hypothetical protein